MLEATPSCVDGMICSASYRAFVPHGFSGVIDLDNACLGDPAIDLAPLIGAFGSARIADIADKETLGKSSPGFTVAVVAELINDSKPRDFALSNFQKRFDAGALQDPHKT